MYQPISKYKVIKICPLMDPEIQMGDIGELVQRKDGFVRLRIHGLLVWFFGDEVRSVR